MMVIFVSQCEKNALKKTRRVLDAFANRIGDNTWQTVITEDGLQTVKKMLRQTASKSTAVSCHWLRSRSRSEFLWVVGSKDKFNQEGIVPVNSTTKEVIMETMQDKAEKHFFYANTHLQSLSEHSFAVGQMAKILCRNLIADEENKLSSACFIAGCLHDIGKVDPAFQTWVQNPKKKDYISDDGQHIDDSKFNFNKHARHNELSSLIYVLLENCECKAINKDLKRAIKHAIYWHHAKPYRNDNDFLTHYHVLKYANTDSTALCGDALKIIQQVIKFSKDYNNSEESFLSYLLLSEMNSDIDDSDLKESNLPEFKKYEAFEQIEKYRLEVETHAVNNIIRACVITADRIISALSAVELHETIRTCKIESLLENSLSIDSNLSMHIEACLKNFPNSARSQKQSSVARELMNARDISVLAGAAGSGKTKIALEWAVLKKAKKILWICPRVQVCQGLFYELTSERYLPNANIEINTGEFKFTNQWGKATNEKNYFSGDIVITTIDQIFGAIITHTKVNTLIDYLNSHVVFDEYHEYINMPALNLLFSELVACKRKRENKANTLLVSATPHYLYVKDLLNIDKDDIKIMPSFNESNYRLEFVIFDETTYDTNPLHSNIDGNAIVISNTARTAQKSFIKNQHQENAVLLHSKFKKSDKKIWFEEVYNSFKQNGTKKFNILRSGPIVQASLNISSDTMISEMTSPENFLQRLGRLDRFGINDNLDKPNVLTIAITQGVIDGKLKGASSKFLNKMHSLQSAKAWYLYLNEKLGGISFVLKDIYDLYNKFYQSDLAKKSVEGDLIDSLKESVNLINAKVIDPIKILPAPSRNIKGRAKIRKASLRGDDRFVQLAICDVTHIKNPVFTNEYAYTIPDDESQEIDNITSSRDEIEGYGSSDKNLLAHMVKKHHNVIKSKKAYKDTVFLNQARDPEFPIYLSYTPKDLDEVGGESARHTEAIYYVVCEKQPIGAMSIQQLNYETE